MMHHRGTIRTPRPLISLILAVLVTAFCSHSHAGGAAPAALPQPVAHALTQAGIAHANVAIWVQPVDADRPSLAINATQAMNPASVMKLVTTFAALERLGPGHIWETRVLARGAVVGGVLHGDLAIVGGGDPMLDFARIWKLLRLVKAQGIREIRGDILLDGSVLALPPHDPARFDGRGLRPYNSGPAGLLMHFNTLNLSLIPPDQPGGTVTVIPQQPLAGLALDARITSSEGACGTWHAALDARLAPGASAEGDRLVLSGSLPHSCGRREWAAAPFPPERYAAALVAGLWAEVGGAVSGQVRAGRAAEDAALLVSDSSPPLADVVREMNKWSSNVIARQLLAHLGADDPADAISAGARRVTQSLAAAGIETTGLVIENGAGLSRIERIRADSLGHLLLAAWSRPYMPEFIASLPVAGLDGTARRRLADSPARGQAHIKTGTIDAVRTFAGYLLDRNGRRHVVVMMVNDARAADSRDAQDALLDWLWQGGH